MLPCAAVCVRVSAAPYGLVLPCAGVLANRLPPPPLPSLACSAALQDKYLGKAMDICAFFVSVNKTFNIRPCTILDWLSVNLGNNSKRCSPGPVSYGWCSLVRSSAHRGSPHHHLTSLPPSIPFPTGAGRVRGQQDVVVHAVDKRDAAQLCRHQREWRRGGAHALAGDLHVWQGHHSAHRANRGMHGCVAVGLCGCGAVWCCELGWGVVGVHWDVQLNGQPAPTTQLTSVSSGSFVHPPIPTCRASRS